MTKKQQTMPKTKPKKVQGVNQRLISMVISLLMILVLINNCSCKQKKTSVTSNASSIKNNECALLKNKKLITLSYKCHYYYMESNDLIPMPSQFYSIEEYLSDKYYGASIDTIIVDSTLLKLLNSPILIYFTLRDKDTSSLINDTLDLKAYIISKYADFDNESCAYEIVLVHSKDYTDKNIYDTIHVVANGGNEIVLNGRCFFEDISFLLKDSVRRNINESKQLKLENFNEFIPKLTAVLKLRKMCFRIDKMGEDQIRVYFCNGVYRDIDLENGNLFLYQMVVGGSLKKLNFKSTEE